MKGKLGILGSMGKISVITSLVYGSSGELYSLFSSFRRLCGFWASVFLQWYWWWWQRLPNPILSL